MVYILFDGTTLGIRNTTTTESMSYQFKIGKTVYL